METLIEAQQKILAELTVDDPEVRRDFLKLYGAKAVQISEHLSRAVMAWRDLDATAGQNEMRAYLSALVFTALTLQVQSTKLFLSGYIVAAGNVFRQAVETTALSLVCSGANLNVLDRFVGDMYSTNDAVRDVLRHSTKLGLKADGVSALKDAQEFYHKYSHPTKLTIASVTSFSEDGLYVGACFDEGKRHAYDKEMDGRVGFAGVSAGFVEAVKANMGQWA